MVRSRDVVQAEGSARTEGARRATGVPADGAAAGAGSLAPGQRWSASRKRDVVLRLLIGVEHLQILCRKPRKHLSELWFVGSMAQHQDVFRIDALPTQEVVQMHFTSVETILKD